MAGAVSFMLIFCLRLVLAFDVFDLGTAISQPRLSKYGIETSTKLGFENRG
jgi:Flp pilus assembly protein TadG